MIPSDHFVRFYNEVFKFLDNQGGLEAYYEEISRHQELHCLQLFSPHVDSFECRCIIYYFIIK